MRLVLLYVLYRDVLGAPHLIGELCRDEQWFIFSYVSPLPFGFSPLAEFPRVDAVYYSDKMFATFQNRIPPKSRPDYDRMMNQWGVVDRTDPFEVLAKNRGRRMTDWLEISAVWPPDV